MTTEKGLAEPGIDGKFWGELYLDFYQTTRESLFVTKYLLFREGGKKRQNHFLRPLN